MSFSPEAQLVQSHQNTEWLIVPCSDVHTTRDLFEVASTDPKSALKSWLSSKAKVVPLDFCGEVSCKSLGSETCIQAMIRIPKTDIVAVLKASGQDGVWVRPFWEDSKKDKLKIVWLPVDVDMLGAL